MNNTYYPITRPDVDNAEEIRRLSDDSVAFTLRTKVNLYAPTKVIVDEIEPLAPRSSRSRIFLHHADDPSMETILWPVLPRPGLISEVTLQPGELLGTSMGSSYPTLVWSLEKYLDDPEDEVSRLSPAKWAFDRNAIFPPPPGTASPDALLDSAGPSRKSPAPRTAKNLLLPGLGLVALFWFLRK